MRYFLAALWSAVWTYLFYTHPWLPFALTPPAYWGIKHWLRGLS